MNLKKLLLDDKHLAPKPVPNSRRQRGMSDSQPTSTNHSAWWVAGIVGTLTALVLSILFTDSGTADQVTIDPVTLCPTDEQYIAQETYIHIDLSEPLDEEQRGWLKELLAVAQNNQLAPRSLFSISQMQTKPKAPRVEVQQFCLPNLTDIDVAGSRVTREDCPAIAEDEEEWWESNNKVRNVGDAARKIITNACKKYVALKAKVQKAADRYAKVSVEQKQSYIVGSIEEVLNASKHANNPRIPTQLIVFSDMLQNAGWFSQYNTKPDEWTVKNLKKQRKSDPAIKELGGKPPPANLKFNKVLICAIPSAHPVLASARNKKTHKEMWEGYLKNRIVRSGSKNIQYIPASACAVAASALMR